MLCFAYAAVEIKHERVCEYEIFKASCTRGTIHIIDAMYGRIEGKYCPRMVDGKEIPQPDMNQGAQRHHKEKSQNKCWKRQSLPDHKNFCQNDRGRDHQKRSPPNPYAR